MARQAWMVFVITSYVVVIVSDPTLFGHFVVRKPVAPKFQPVKFLVTMQELV